MSRHSNQTIPRAELESSLAVVRSRLAALETERSKLVAAQRATLLILYMAHDMSMADLGRLAGLSATAIMRNLHAAGLEPGGAHSKPGPRPKPPPGS